MAPLHYLATSPGDKAQLVKLLMAKNADVLDGWRKDGQPVLHGAIQNGNKEVALALLSDQQSKRAASSCCSAPTPTR